MKHVEDKVELRDRFAIAAITGLLSSLDDDPHYVRCAYMAYKIADAMLEEREKKPGRPMP